MQITEKHLWATIFSYLPIRDRTSCAVVCTLFKRLLEESECDAILWPKQFLRKITIHPERRFPCVQKAFQRTFLNAALATPFAEKLASTGVVFSFGPFLIAGGDAGDAKIWHTGRKNFCTQIIAPIDSWGELKWTHCGNWLIRGSYQIISDRLFQVFDVWEIDEQEGRATSIFTTQGEFSGNLSELISPVRYQNLLCTAYPWSSSVEVYKLGKDESSYTIIGDGIAVQQLEVHRDQLIVKYADNSLFIRDLANKCPIASSSLGPAPSCALIAPYRASLNAENCVVLTSLTEIMQEPLFFLSLSNAELLFGTPFAIDEEWVGFRAVNEDRETKGVFIFNLLPAKDKKITEYAFIPISFPDDPDPSVLQVLTWPFYAYTYSNQLFVFELWDLKKNDKGTVVPSKIYDLPEGSEVSDMCLHNSQFVVAAADGSVYRFS